MLQTIGLLLIFAVAALLIQAAVVLWGIATGLLIHWVWPRVDFGMGVLIGVISGIPALYLAWRLLSGVTVIQAREEEERPIIPPPTSPWQRSRRKPRRP